MAHILWFPHPKNDNVTCGIHSDHNLVDCEIEHWVHTVHGDVYEPIEIIRAYQNGRSTSNRVRMEGADIPYMIHSLEEAKQVCEERFGCIKGGE